MNRRAFIGLIASLAAIPAGTWAAFKREAVVSPATGVDWSGIRDYYPNGITTTESLPNVTHFRTFSYYHGMEVPTLPMYDHTKTKRFHRL